MHSIRTVQDLLHRITNALSLISSHAQYLSAKTEAASAREVLDLIRDEADRAAGLLSLVPKDVLEAVLGAVDVPFGCDVEGAGRRDVKDDGGDR